jgi:hypothetical protein
MLGDRWIHSLASPYVDSLMKVVYIVALTAVAAAAIAIVVAVARYVLEVQKIFQTSEAKREQSEVEAILAAHAPLSAEDELEMYVQRGELEGTLESFVRKPIKTVGYMIVVGPRGAGKSTLVSNVLSKMGKGVVVVTIDVSSATVPELRALILKAALDQFAPHKESEHAASTPVKDGDLVKLLKAAANAGRNEGRGEGWRPTLAFEITSSGDGTLIKNACTVLKQLSADQPLCHGLSAALPRPSRAQQLVCGGRADGRSCAATLSACRRILA